MEKSSELSTSSSVSRSGISMEVAILDAIAEDDLSSKPTLNVPISLHPIDIFLSQFLSSTGKVKNLSLQIYLDIFCSICFFFWFENLMYKISVIN